MYLQLIFFLSDEFNKPQNPPIALNSFIYLIEEYDIHNNQLLSVFPLS